MIYLTSLLIFSLSSITSFAYGQSSLLENVKRNPEEAIALCNKFRTLNSQGISSASTEVIEEISLDKNLTKSDAEILSIYVIAMHCPDIN